MAAAEEGYDEIVEILVKHGADVHVRLPEDARPIMVSAGYSLKKRDHGDALGSWC